MAQKKSQLQRYTPEVQQATSDIIRQLPAELNSLALQAKIAEAIVARSEARILGAINEALAYRPGTPAPAPQQQPQNIRTGDINIKIDCSQNINYWADNSQHYTDNSSRNYWADNRRYEDNSSRNYTDNSTHSSTEIFGFDLSAIGWMALILMFLALAFSQPCTQQFQHQQQQQELQGGSAI